MSAAEARQLMEQLWEGTDPRDLALSGAELAAASRRRITEEDEERVAFDRFLDDEAGYLAFHQSELEGSPA